MKRFFSILLVLVLCFNLGITAFAAGNHTVYMTSEGSSANVGEYVYVNIGSETAFSSVGTAVYVYFDSSALELDREKSSIGTASTAFTLGAVQTNASGTYVSVSFFSPMAAVSVGSGNYYTLAFKVLKAGESSVSMKGEIFGADSMTMLNAVTTDTVTVTGTEEPAPVANGYTLTADADKTANVGENVSVAFTVGSSETAVTEYNAYDMSFTYDSDKLTYVSAAAADTDASITEADGVIRVIGYGESKALGTAAVTLNFTTKAAGEANVKATAANIDNRANAPDKDTPAATLMDDTTVINVEEKFNVTLGEGLTADTLIAESGKDYSFSATDADNYDYVVSAAINGATVTVTDNGDGTYTIPGADITGPITVTATRTGKAQTVSVQGSGAEDVTAAPTANYGTDYTFTVNKQVGYKYTVTVTVDGSTVATDAGENGYTIPGTAITGPVVIAVTRTMEGSAPSYTVTKPTFVTGPDKATAGEDYTFVITAEEGYSYSAPEVTVGGEKVTVTQNADGSYVIAGKDVTGDIVIKVSRTSEKGITVTEYITLNEKSMYLVTVSGPTGEGNIAKYAGNSMYWSDVYGENGAYAWLLVSDKSLAEMEIEAENNVTFASGTAAAVISYSGDVNMTNKPDVNDAQLTYDMYKARYESFVTVSMEKFLRADVNGSSAVDTQDAAAIVAAIQTP